MATILQSDVAVKFVYPFLLIFFILFAILEKTKVLGDDKKSINAWVAGIVALIFVSAVTPKLIVGNLVLFLSIALIIIFVVLLLWGFVSAGDENSTFTKAPKGLKWVIGIVVVLGTLVVVSTSVGIDVGGIFGNLFNSSWSESFWSNALFIVLVAVALAVAIKSGAGGKSE
jgi:hypothetical protein